MKIDTLVDNETEEAQTICYITDKKRYEARRKLKKYVKVGAATTAVAAAGTAKVIMSNKNKKK